VNPGSTRTADGDPVSGNGPVTRENQDHLQTRKRFHEGTVIRAEAREVLRRDEREVHARLEYETLFLRPVEVEALRVTHVVRDPLLVLSHENERRVTGEALAESGEQPAEPRTEQQRRASHGSASHDHGTSLDPVFTWIPGAREPLFAVDGTGDSHDHRVILDPQGLGPCHHFHPGCFGGRKLHPVGSHLGRIRASEVAQARSATAVHIHRKLLRLETDPSAAEFEQPVVVVDLALGKQVDVILFGEPPAASGDVVVVQSRHVPLPDHALRGDQRRARIDCGRSSVRPAERQRQRPLFREEATGILVKGSGHLRFRARVFVFLQPGALLQHEHLPSVRGQRGQCLCDRSTAGAGADDHRVGMDPVHRRASQPRASAR